MMDLKFGFIRLIKMKYIIFIDFYIIFKVFLFSENGVWYKEGRFIKI